MQQYDKKKIFAVCLIVVSLLTLALPWIKITGVDQSYINSLDQYMGLGNMMGAADIKEARAVSDFIDVVRDLGVSPLETFSLLVKHFSFGLLAESQSNDYDSGVEIVWGCIIFELLFLLTIFAGIYALICTVKGKPLIGKMEGTVFTILMVLLGITMAAVAMTADSWINENSIFKFGMRPTLWILLGILTALPFNLWDKALANIPGWKGTNTGTIPSPGPGPGPVPVPPAHEWVCSNCGYVNTPDASYCSKCGCKKGEKKNPPQSRWRCTNCGFMNPENVGTCQSCGAPKGWKPLAQKSWRCNFCGFDNPESIRTCQRCGHSKDWKPGTIPQPEPIPNPEPTSRPAPKNSSDDPFEGHYLLGITRDEARNGCEKQFKYKDEIISVVVPTGANEDTVIIVPQKGRYDSKHDRYGNLRVQLRVH